MLTDDELWELAKQDKPITREELGLPPAEDDSGLNTYRESIIYTKKDLIFVEVGMVIIYILLIIAAFLGCFG